MDTKPSSAFIQIRPCTRKDLPAVIDLLQQLGDVTEIGTALSLEHVQKLFDEMQAQPAFYHNIVCDVDGRVVGFESLIFYQTLIHHGGTTLINELVVDQTYRGQGIGKKLIEYAIQEARRRGTDEIEVGTEKDNLPARRFYHEAGITQEYLLLGMGLGR